MKHLFIYLSFFSLTHTAQNIEKTEVRTPKPLNYEIGFNLYSLTNLKPRYFYGDGYEYSYDQNFFSGIFVKRHFSKNCVRTNFDLYRKAINSYTESDNGEKFSQHNGNISTIAFRLGYERELGTKKLVPFLSADLIFMTTTYKGFISGTKEFRGSISTVKSEYLNIVNEYAFGLGSGLKWKLRNNIQLSYEFNWQVGYSRLKESQGPDVSGFRGTVFRINPVRQLGLSILI